MKKMKKKIKKMKNVLLTIFSVFLLSILLPSADVYTDLNLVYNLYLGTYSCNTTSEMKNEWGKYEYCLTTHYSSDQCPHPRTLNDSMKLFEDYLSKTPKVGLDVGASSKRRNSLNFVVHSNLAE